MSSTNPAFKHLQFSLKEVLKATNNFDDKYVIGRGGFGKVYKGQLLVSGEMVNIAARRLDPKRRQRGDVEFSNEIAMLSSLKHENIVSLIGFCDENGEKIIIIKRETTKGSLSMHLSKPALTWIQRLNICVGVARALRYIHSGEEGRGDSVIHRNINSYTVLLDAKFEAKLSGFEYSFKQSVTRTQLVLSEAIGITGYMDPLIVKTGGVSRKSDIYSFGVVLCEILCGRKAFIPDVENRFLASLFGIHYEKGSLNDIIHPDLRLQMTQKSLTEISEVAYNCLKENSAKRPKMEDIVTVLEKALELENLIKKLDHLKIPLSHILSATENLSDSCSIGDRDYCSLYAAELEHFDEENPSIKEVKDNDEQKPVRRNTVIIKRDTVFKQPNNIENKEKEENKEEEEKEDFKLNAEWFYREINILHTCTHPGIVELLGFCVEGSEMILVVEYLSNGTLNHLWYDEDKPTLTWAQRLIICLDVANALNYLHYEMKGDKMVLHHNIQSGTIALDENLRAKITDFGFSSLLLPLNQYDDYIMGNGCWMDPYMNMQAGEYNRDSDVYSFGVFLFEVLCGTQADDSIYEEGSDAEESDEEESDAEDSDEEESSFEETSTDVGLAREARRCFQNGTLMEMIDPLLLEEDDTGENNGFILKNKMSLQIYIRIAYWCMAKTRDQRPTMKVVVKELQKALFFQEDKTQQLDMVQDVVKSSIYLWLKNAILLKKLEHLNIPLKNILSATKNFSKRREDMDVGYYRSYIAELKHFDEEENPSIREQKNKGELTMRRNTTVVIKRFHPMGDELFYNEIEMLDTCKHPHIVRLLGFCVGGYEKILVVEHFSNGYLCEYWQNINGKMPTTLTWAQRLKICLDAAKALNYLHNEMEDGQRVLYLITSGNIGLDKNWRAKIVSFSGCSVLLSKNEDDNQDAIWETAETHYKLTRESNIQSFGVVLLEALSGRVVYDSRYLKESDMPSVAPPSFQEGTLMEIIDPTLKGGPNKESLEKLVKLAHECIAETQNQHPTIEVVIQELQEALFFQDKQLNMVHVVDGVEELKLTRGNSEDETQRPDIQDSEVEKPMELKLRIANLIAKLKHLKIPLSDIKLATDNFSEASSYRRTECYKSYKFDEVEHFDEEGNLSMKEGKNKSDVHKKRSVVAINRFHPSEDEDFYKEFKMLDTCNHPSIVKLLGFCVEGSEMILVVEYPYNRYLNDHLSFDDKPILTWAQRLKICLDVANALNYLHYEMADGQSVVNGDIQSSNIALDKNWGAKIAEFGYSVFLSPNEDDEAPYEYVRGITDVYIDPEYRKTHRLTRESDVYSFGAVLFEVLCGRLANDPIYLNESDQGLPFVARRFFREGTLMEMIDPLLEEESDENSYILKRGPNKDSLDMFVKIAYQCVTEIPNQRPPVNVVVKELQEALLLQENKDVLIMSLHDIKLATKYFNDKNRIGLGGFGEVYRGEVPQGDGFNTIVAKRLDTRHGQGEKEFRNEIQILFEYKHENIISLVGYCNEKDEKVIVYEYASRGSLDRYLKDDRLTWMKRLNICIHVASALAFLHGGAGRQAIVIHRDIKTPNILLNDEWDAKLADFGFSLISPINNETGYVIDHACGTEGYLDPLYSEFGYLTIESDIYSFGVVLFEIMCGKFLTGVIVKEIFEKGKIDDFVFEAIKKQIEPKALIPFKTIAYQCLHDDREKRPTAKEVLEKLEEARKSFHISGSD